MTDPGLDPDLYVPRRSKLAAKQWTGDNFAEVETFARKWIGDPDEIGLRNEPDEYTRGDGSVARFNALQFYAAGDDQEADPGTWIFVHVDPDKDGGRRVELLHHDRFVELYEKVTPA